MMSCVCVCVCACQFFHCLFSRHEAMTDLVNIFNSLVNTSGDILIPCVNDSVRELTEEEEATYEPIEFDVVS